MALLIFQTRRNPYNSRFTASALLASVDLIGFLKMGIPLNLFRSLTLLGALWVQIFAQPALGAEAVDVFVSVPPQKFLVERIGGDSVSVSVLVGPGRSPETYSPTPQQMSRLGDAKLYFKIGAPFEKAWSGRIAANFPGLRFVDSARGVALIPMGEHHHKEGARHDEDALDPHIWCDPNRLIRVAENIRDALIETMPNRKAEYMINSDRLTQDLRTLDRRIADRLADSKGKGFLASHPSWGYFAQRYGLSQHSIEFSGREPSARQTAELINRARSNRVRAVVVQQQFSRRSADAVARSINATVIVADPLAEDLLVNLMDVADRLAAVLEAP